MQGQNSRHLIVDGQIFQSAARDRGMGRYSEYLLSAIMREGSYKTIHLIFAKKPHATGIKNKSLEELFSGANVVYLDLTSTTRQNLKSAMQHNEKTVNQFIDKLNLDPSTIDFLIPSLFQEPIVSVFPTKTNNSVIFYDLIPYLYYNRYADKMPFDNYLKRFKTLFEADKILTISQAVQDDLAVYLGIPHDRIRVVDGAAIRSSKKPVAPLGLHKPDKFILMPTSDDPRKNNLRAVLGFEQFNARASSSYKLVITSKIHKSERERLQSFSNNIIFTGNIAEAELDWLYGEAAAVLFVPESEGLGLPILEAVHVDKRVVCSSLDVFKEISSEAFYYCDHEDQYSIANAIEAALKDTEKGIPKTEYKRILKHYSWEETARRAITAMTSSVKRVRARRPKIAIFTPTPSGFSAVGKVVAESHATLADYFDVDYYAEEGLGEIVTRPNYLQYVANYYPADSFSVKRYADYQAVFYHIGNSDYHLESITNSLYLPGYAILHDTNVTDAYRIMVQEGIISRERSDLEKTITNTGRLTESKYMASVVTNQLGILAHSDYAIGATHEILKRQKLKTVRTNLPTQAPQALPDRDYDRIRLGMAGIIADIKGIEVVERLAKDIEYRQLAISIFGYNYASPDTIERLQSYDNIELSTNLTDYDFVKNMRKLDIFVNYRMKYQGETSLSTLEAMRQGVVVIVRDVGWYSELPDDSVVKVSGPEDLIAKLKRLIGNPDLLKKISQKAIEYVKSNHSHEQYAMGMREIVELRSDDSLDTELRAMLLRTGKLSTKNALLSQIRMEK